MRLLSLCALGFFLGVAVASASAQGRPPAGGGAPGGYPSGGRGPGGPGGPGGMGGPGSMGGVGGNGTSPSGSNSRGGAGDSTSGAPHLGPVGRWWDDKSVVQAIGLSKDQQKRMDVVFNANKGAILATYKTYLAEQAKLTALSKQPQVDQPSLFAAIDAVSQARAALQKANTQMLLQIRQQLDAGQINRLEKLQ